MYRLHRLPLDQIRMFHRLLNGTGAWGIRASRNASTAASSLGIDCSQPSITSGASRGQGLDLWCS